MAIVAVFVIPDGQTRSRRSASNLKSLSLFDRRLPPHLLCSAMQGISWAVMAQTLGFFFIDVASGLQGLGHWTCWHRLLHQLRVHRLFSADFGAGSFPVGLGTCWSLARWFQRLGG